MKKQMNLGTASAAVGMALTLLTGCSKEDITVGINKMPTAEKQMYNSINDATFSQQLAYVNNNLDILGKAAILMSDDSRFQYLLYTEMSGYAEDDKSVLFTTLFSKSLEQGWDLKAEMELKLSQQAAIDVDLQSIFDAFKNLDGEDWNPQLFIPNYDRLLQSGKIGNSGYNRPAYITYSGDESISSAPAYWFAQAGPVDVGELGSDPNQAQFRQAFVANEATSADHELFVISLSEVPASQVILPKAPANSRPTSTTAAVGRVAIGNMKVMEHKESWLAGKSDVAIAGRLRWNTFQSENPTLLTNPKPGCTKDCSAVEIYPISTLLTRYDGDNSNTKVRKFTRSEVRNQTVVNVNESITAQWNPYYTNTNGDILLSYESSGEYGYYLIYEADPWPIGKRTYSWNIAPLNVQETVYRSADDYYATDSFSAKASSPIYFVGHSVSNNAINYTLKNY